MRLRKWLAVIVLLGGSGLGLLYFQIPTRLIAKGYPVQGIDVSHYREWKRRSIDRDIKIVIKIY